MSFDPGQTMVAVDQSADTIEQAAAENAEAIERAAEIEMAYEQALEEQLLIIYHESKETGQRMPAEDVRRALAHKKMQQGLYGSHLLAKARVASTDKLLKGALAATSARQSVLKALGGVA